LSRNDSIETTDGHGFTRITVGRERGFPGGGRGTLFSEVLSGVAMSFFIRVQRDSATRLSGPQVGKGAREKRSGAALGPAV
jgi:hypothetical protein